MRLSYYQKLNKKHSREWDKNKKREWAKNKNFWIKIIQENLDPYRLIITNKAVLSLIKNKKLKILDAGCGEGYLSRSLAKRGHNVYGLDITKEFIDKAQKIEKQRPLGINYSQGDFRKTKFKSSSFDLIVSHQTINEVNNPNKAVREFSRILKKKGEIVVLFLHPCFEINLGKEGVLDYFREIKIKKNSYSVGGINSPSPYFYLHLPLSRWINIFLKNSFSIKKIEEPHPPLKLLEKNTWWQNKFKKPIFLLIKASKD